jgi:NAD(P)-dependent dehydrogenase (short-subunit alcohol dehydrogenase family)
VRINAASPGPVETDLWLGEHGVAETVAAATGVDAATARENIVAGMGGIPSNRFTRPDEVATLVVLLASPLTANVTGANHVIRRRPHQDDVVRGSGGVRAGIVGQSARNSSSALLTSSG